MNIAMEQTEEYVNGQLKNKYGDCFIRGNNGEAAGACRGVSTSCGRQSRVGLHASYRFCACDEQSTPWFSRVGSLDRIECRRDRRDCARALASDMARSPAAVSLAL